MPWSSSSLLGNFYFAGKAKALEDREKLGEAFLKIVKDTEYTPPIEVSIVDSRDEPIKIIADEYTGELPIDSGYTRLKMTNKHTYWWRAFSFHYKPDHHYEIYPRFQLPLKRTLSSATGLPGYKPLPPKPELLPESTDERRFALWAVPASSVLSGLVFLTLYAVTKNPNVPEKNEYGKYFVIGLGVGAVGGLVGELIRIGTTPPETPHAGNIKKNKILLNDWRMQIEQVNRYNDSLLKEANNRIREENQKIIDKNKTRMVWAVKCVTDNTETTIELK